MTSDEFYARTEKLRQELNELGKQLGMPDDDAPLSDVDRLALTSKSELEKRLKS